MKHETDTQCESTKRIKLLTGKLGAGKTMSFILYKPNDIKRLMVFPYVTKIVELEKQFNHIVCYYHNKKDKSTLDELKKYDFVCVTFETLFRVYEAFDEIIIDEAHLLLEDSTYRNIRIEDVIKIAEHKDVTLITATPFELIKYFEDNNIDYELIEHEGESRVFVQQIDIKSYDSLDDVLVDAKKLKPHYIYCNNYQFINALPDYVKMWRGNVKSRLPLLHDYKSAFTRVACVAVNIVPKFTDVVDYWIICNGRESICEIIQAIGRIRMTPINVRICIIEKPAKNEYSHSYAGIDYLKNYKIRLFRALDYDTYKKSGFAFVINDEALKIIKDYFNCIINVHEGKVKYGRAVRDAAWHTDFTALPTVYKPFGKMRQFVPTVRVAGNKVLHDKRYTMNIDSVKKLASLFKKKMNKYKFFLKNIIEKTYQSMNSWLKLIDVLPEEELEELFYAVTLNSSIN